ncbi:MAG: DUF2567 domain-containing protein [Gordonia sp. (in: high G+C Gram-positive bacteria)]|uniref:DUF2567 domain-containing protein n=1 Tax=Gordonia sp. (in: high G+C Gram-positive bacteria) TaxID=84139 RepID=UPI0039E4D3F8
MTTVPAAAAESSSRRFDPTALLVGVGMLVLGAAAGTLWAFTTPVATVEVTGDGVAFSAAQTARLFGGVAVFGLIAAGLGLLIGVLVWVLLTKARGPAGVLFAVVGAASSSGIAMQVGESIAAARFPGIDAHTVGTYRMTGGLWLTDAALAGLPTPWLLLTCAPGMAALVYFIGTAGASDTADDEPESSDPATAP